jgi:fructose-1,6-bisphosphatase I
MAPTTLTQHIRLAQSNHPGASGNLSALLTQIGVAGKIISSKVNMAGLVKLLGTTGRTNVQGETVQKLDEFADHTFEEIVGRSGHVCALLSEEQENVIEVPERHRGEYVVAYDPLDGSSNIDFNVSIGTIFSVYRRETAGADVTNRDLLRRGREQVAAGYIIYGSSTVFVYSVGDGVHGFTLDPSVGEYVLSHEDIRVPPRCKNLSINHCNAPYWDRWTHEFIDRMMARNDADKRRINCRHIGSLVADFHRNLLSGGVFLYPADSRARKGKLRLMYEGNPLAWIVEQAGGYASDGCGAVLDIQPEELHHRIPLVIGNTAEVKLAEQIIAEHDRAWAARDDGVLA